MLCREARLVALLPLKKVLGSQQLENVVPHLVITHQQAVRPYTKSLFGFPYGAPFKAVQATKHTELTFADSLINNP